MADDAKPVFNGTGLAGVHIGDLFSNRLREQISDRWTPVDLFTGIEIGDEVANKIVLKVKALDLNGKPIKRFVRMLVTIYNRSMELQTDLQFTAEVVSPPPSGHNSIAPNPRIIAVTSDVTGELDLEFTDVVGGFNNFVIVTFQPMVEVGILIQFPLFFDAV